MDPFARRRVVGIGFVTAVVLIAPAVLRAQPFLFVGSAPDDAVAVVDLTDHSLRGTFPLAGTPAGAALSPGGRRLFVTRAMQGSVAMIDTAAGGVTSIPVGDTPAGVAVGPRGHRAYVANSGDDTVSVIDPRSATVVATVPVGDAPVEVVAGGDRVYVANGGEKTVSVVDARTNAVVATLPVGTFPCGLALHHPTGRLFVANFLDDSVSVIDTVSLAVIGTVTVRRGPRGLAFDPLARRLYVAGFDGGTIDVIDTDVLAIVQQGSSGGANPVDLVLGPDRQLLYVAHLQAGEPLRVLDAVTLGTQAAIEGPAGPVALAGFGMVAPPPAGPVARVREALRALLPGARPPRRDRRPVRGPDASVTISDDDFVPADWQVFSAVGAHGVFQEENGGNPGWWRRMIHFAGPSPTRAVHRFVAPSGRYDPAESGAVGTIDATWDRRAELGTMRERMVVFQDGVAYRSALQVFGAASWQGASYRGLTAADFDDGNGGQPDFDATGPVLTFGYERETLPLEVNQGHGIDNFSVVIHPGTSGGPGLVGLADRVLTVAVNDSLDVTLERVGGSTGAGTARVLATGGGDTVVAELEWADGDSAPKSFTLNFGNPPSPAAGTARLRITSVTGDLVMDERRRDGTIFVYRSDWPLASFFLFLQILLSSWPAAWLAAAAGLALCLAAARALGRRAAVVAAALALAGGLAGCHPTSNIRSGSAPEGIFNDRIRPDGQPLVDDSSRCTSTDLDCLQRRTDPWVGHYRHGEADVVSEVFPELPTDAATSRLPLSDCLWTPVGQPLRASWEGLFGLDPGQALGHAVVNGDGELAADADARYGADFYPGGLRWFSACRIDTPYDRDPLAITPPLACEWADQECPECAPGPYWLAATGDITAFSLACGDPTPVPIGSYLRRAFAFDVDLRAAPYVDPRPGHNLCAPAPPGPSDVSVTSWVTGCPVENGLLDACGDRCLFQPDRDASLSVRSTYYGRARTLSPTIMTIGRDATRRLVRPMQRPGGAFVWRTPDSSVRNDAGPPDPEAPGLRWVENFTPDLRVIEARVLHIDAAGAERPLAPARLLVLDPSGNGSVWDCAGEERPDGSRLFRFMSSAACRRNDEPASPLVATPTYVVSNVTGGGAALGAPLTWQADLSPLWPEGEIFLELVVQNQACQAPACNALKAQEAEVDLGGLQIARPHRFLLEVTNVGPEPLRVDDVQMEAVAGYPDARADFRLEPLWRVEGAPGPIEVEPDGDLVLASDYATNPLADAIEVSGRHAFVRALAADGVRVTVAGQDIEAEGNSRFEGGRITASAFADFPWTPSVAGNRRLFGEVVHLHRPLPFYVDPGRSFWVRVTAVPSAQGHRHARMAVSATASSGPAILRAESLLKARGLTGPSLSVLPSVVSLPSRRMDASGQVVEHWDLNVFAANYGGVDLARTAVAITGPDAARFHLSSAHSPVQVIPPGGDERFVVGYAPSCVSPLAPVPAHGPRQYQAELRVTTSSGDAVVALRGEWCPQP